MSAPTLLAVPNVSEGRDEAVISAVRDAFAIEGVRLLDTHSDPDHHRSVFTIAGPPGLLAEAVASGARAAAALIDVMSAAARQEQHAGQHPHVGSLDVAPIVYLHESARGAACAEALVLADRIGAELEVPVLLYGELTAGSGAPGRARSDLRRGGVLELARRLDGNAGPTSLAPDFGPARLHPRAGATLVAARAPLVAFNLELSPPASIEDARAVAAAVREGGASGLPGVRAIAVALTGGAAQVSMNVERPLEVPLAAVVESVRRHAGVARAELVGLAPAVALEGFPADVPIAGFDPARQVIENALGCS